MRINHGNARDLVRADRLCSPSFFFPIYARSDLASSCANKANEKEKLNGLSLSTVHHGNRRYRSRRQRIIMAKSRSALNVKFLIASARVCKCIYAYGRETNARRSHITFTICTIYREGEGGYKPPSAVIPRARVAVKQSERDPHNAIHIAGLAIEERPAAFAASQRARVAVEHCSTAI